MTIHYHGASAWRPASPPAEATAQPIADTPGSTALLAIGYLVAASISLIITRVEGSVACLWIATALLLPRLARQPWRSWASPLAGCAIACMVASSLFGAGPVTALPFAVMRVGEAAIGALLLRRFAPDGRYFDDVPRLARFGLLVGVAMPILPALGGAAIAHVAVGMSFRYAVLAWFSVHALGALTFMPVVILLTEDTGNRRISDFDARRPHGRENLAIVLVMALIVVLVFDQQRMPLLFLPMLPLTLLVFRAGRFGAALGICILAGVGGGLTLAGHGPARLAFDDPAARAMFYQFYLAVTVTTILPMAVELNRRKALTRRLEDSEAMFHLMADRSGDVLLNLDVEGRIRYCSPSVARFGIFDGQALVGQHSLKLVAEDDRILAATVHGRALARPNETFVFEYRAITAMDAMTWFETHTRAIVDRDGIITGVVSAARDITHRKVAEAKLVDTANSDPLTGLGNRRRFDDQLRRALNSPVRADHLGCLAIVDIDFFKRVNDGHGHPVGDEVLKAVAARLQPMLRATDLVARIGGEEFGLLLHALPMADAHRLCERLREDIAAHPVTVGTAAIAVTVSIGIAELAEHRVPGALFAAADAALYRAKAEGRNCVRLAF